MQGTARLAAMHHVLEERFRVLRTGAQDPTELQSPLAALHRAFLGPKTTQNPLLHLLFHAFPCFFPSFCFESELQDTSEQEQRLLDIHRFRAEHQESACDPTAEPQGRPNEVFHDRKGQRKTPRKALKVLKVIFKRCFKSTKRALRSKPQGIRIHRAPKGRRQGQLLALSQRRQAPEPVDQLSAPQVVHFDLFDQRGGAQSHQRAQGAFGGHQPAVELLFQVAAHLFSKTRGRLLRPTSLSRAL